LRSAVVGGAVEEDGEGLGEGGCAGSWETGADYLERGSGFGAGRLLAHDE
jgi:hypothetical protein